MNKCLIFCLSVLLAVCSCSAENSEFASTPATEDSMTNYEAGTCTVGDTTLYYRYAEINPREDATRIVVLVLHGGPLKGSDNESQLKEAAVDSVVNYLEKKKITAVLLVPQCPQTDTAGHQISWTSFTHVLYELVKRYKTSNNTPCYIFGASIGGVGTWKMLSEYPTLFTAAMPCAADPTGYDVASMTHTKIYTVMGSEDTWASLANIPIQNYVSGINALGGDCRLDIINGWDHVATCEGSFSTERLDWIFTPSTIIH
jgi:predicted peptidase